MRRRLRRWAVWSVSVVVVTLFPAGPALAAPVHGWGDYHTFPSNLTVGTSAYGGGVWSYTDRWGDDTGANTDGKHREDYFPGLPMATYDAFGAHRLATNGDYVLPNDDTRTPELTADIVFVQGRPSSSGIDVRVAFTSLGTKDSTILSIGLNTTGGSGSSQFPRNAHLDCTGCGVDRYVTVWGTGSEVADSRGRAVGAVTGLSVDTIANTISFTVPFSALGRVGSTLGVWLAAGLNDQGHPGSYWTVQPSCTGSAPCARYNATSTTPTPTNVFDLAFVRENRQKVDDRVQADLLARGQAGPARAMVDLAAAAGGVRRVEGEPTSGPVERILVSALDEGDGIDSGTTAATFQNPSAGQNFHYLPRLEPYLVNLPQGYSPGRRYPMIVVLHGYNGSYDELYFLAPRLRQAMASHGYLAVYPLGRGDVQYERDGELDVLEVRRAAAAEYLTDATRVHVTGISMGGFGTTKMATRHPDVFATGGLAVGGEDGDVNVVNSHESEQPLPTVLIPGVLANLQDTPMFLAAAGGDADPLTAGATDVYAQLHAYGDEVHLIRYLARSHEVEDLDDSTPQLLAMWQRNRLTPVPARVNYTFDTGWSFGPLVDDGAYWLDALTPRTGTQATVRAEALSLPRALTTLVDSTSSGFASSDPRSAYVLQDALRQVTGQRPVSNALDLDLTDLASGRVNLARLHVDPTRRYCVDVTNDSVATATVVLRGVDFRGHTVAGAASAVVTASSVTVTVDPGTSSVVVAPPGVDPAPGQPCA